MPIYGKAKTKTMIKSILPSTERKAAKKAKDQLHRKNRRRSSQQCVKFSGYAQEVIDAWENDSSDFEYWVEPHNAEGWISIVDDRREADKLAHFEKWAYEKTKHLPRNDRLFVIKTILPRNVIGEHALSHLSFLEPVHPGNENGYYSSGLPRQYRRRHSPAGYIPAEVKRRAVFNAVHAIARDDAKRKAFNDYLVRNAKRDRLVTYRTDFNQLDLSYKYYKPYKRFEHYEYFEGVRTLNGYHDVYKFVRDIYAAQKNDPKLGYHPSWLTNVKAYFNIN